MDYKLEEVEYMYAVKDGVRRLKSIVIEETYEGDVLESDRIPSSDVLTVGQLVWRDYSRQQEPEKRCKYINK